MEEEGLYGDMPELVEARYCRVGEWIESDHPIYCNLKRTINLDPRNNDPEWVAKELQKLTDERGIKKLDKLIDEELKKL